MLVIEYTNDRVFGEDGPNYVRLGKCEDFKRLYDLLTPLKEKDGVGIALQNTKSEIELQGIEGCAFRSEETGRTLTKKAGNYIETILPKETWGHILILFKGLANTKGTHYVEPEGDFIEELNWIMESS